MGRTGKLDCGLGIQLLLWQKWEDLTAIRPIPSDGKSDDSDTETGAQI